MFAQIISIVTVVAVANAGILSAPLATPLSAPSAYSAPIQKVATPFAYTAPYAKVAAPVAVASAVQQEEYDPHPQYSYGYDIQDTISGDNKQQQETRDGDTVQGSYSLVEPDGTRRIVQYTADPVNGFNAIVSKEPLAVKVAAAPIVTKTIPQVTYAAPVAKFAAPLAYTAPVAKLVASPFAYSAPLTKVF